MYVDEEEGGGERKRKRENGKGGRRREVEKRDLKLGNIRDIRFTRFSLGLFVSFVNRNRVPEL